MKRFFLVTASILSLVACGDGTNPIVNNGTEDDLDLPDGTEYTAAGSPIERYEAQGENGNGYAQSITYNAANDTFSVDNLPFDGDNTYARDGTVPTLGGFGVYAADAIFPDSVTGAPIDQNYHRALLLQGDTGTQVAIVRTGSYRDYGFGGFLYSRDGGVELPETGQAKFTGGYAGLRDFQGLGGLEYVSGTAVGEIDFDDFNEGNGVQIVISNRQVFNANGVNITDQITDGMSGDQMPDLYSVTSPNVMDEAGEMTSGMRSAYIDLSGELVQYEQGSYYALVSGTGADMEMAGVIVVEGEDPRSNYISWYEGIIVRETGGFILER